MPHLLSERLQIEADLLTSLQQNSIMPALIPEAERLMNLTADTPASQLPQPVVVLPDARVEPVVLRDLDRLREESFSLHSHIWTVGRPSCGDCVPALGFSR